jgi:hypothetical protein
MSYIHSRLIPQIARSIAIDLRPSVSPPDPHTTWNVSAAAQMVQEYLNILVRRVLDVERERIAELIEQLGCPISGRACHSEIGGHLLNCPINIAAEIRLGQLGGILDSNLYPSSEQIGSYLPSYPDTREKT